MRRSFSHPGRFLVAIVLAAVMTGGSTHAADVPSITQLKPLSLQTDLVRDGQAQAAIVVPASGAYDGPARRIVEAVKHETGVELPVLKDDSPDAALPLRRHLIALGNRSTCPGSA
jgi:ABC-type Zn2+ transport system substrate-binding protein/surface adhesin